MLNQHMTLDHLDREQYRSNLLNILKRDKLRCKRFLLMCRNYIQEAASHNDDETVQAWANQQDVVLQEIASINAQLKQF
jgi:hypothetical protein